MANVQFAGVTHRYEGTDRPAVDRLDLDIADGEFLVLVGPSGCGKSTSLRMLAGLESASDGRIEIVGRTGSFAKVFGYRVNLADVDRALADPGFAAWVATGPAGATAFVDAWVEAWTGPDDATRPPTVEST